VLSLAALSAAVQQSSFNTTTACSDARSENIAAKPRCSGRGTVQDGERRKLSAENKFLCCFASVDFLWMKNNIILHFVCELKRHARNVGGPKIRFYGRTGCLQ